MRKSLKKLILLILKNSLKKIYVLLICSILLALNLFSQVPDPTCAHLITVSHSSGNPHSCYTIFPRTGGIANFNDLHKPLIVVEGFDYEKQFDYQDI